MPSILDEKELIERLKRVKGDACEQNVQYIGHKLMGLGLRRVN